MMGNQLRPKNRGAHKLSDKLKTFKSQLEREILSVAWYIKIPKRCKIVGRWVKY